MTASVRTARSLRRRSSATEQHIWRLLRGGRFAELKFRRQVPIGPYVADFVCLRHRLVVELDGPLHDEAHDRARDTWFSAQGFRVLRFKNSEATAATVTSAIWSAIDVPRTPSPLAGEGVARRVTDEGST